MSKHHIFVTLFLFFSLVRGLPALAGDTEPIARSPGLDWEKYQAGVVADWSSYQEHEAALWQTYKERVSGKWGKDAQLTGKKTYVEYFSNDRLRVRINFEKGTMTFESLDQNWKESKKSVSKILDHLLKEKVIEKAELPKDPKGALGSDVVVGLDHRTRERRTFTLKMREDHLAVRIRRYLPLVLKYSALNEVEPALVLAVINQESAFNPRARSWVPAYGLMQIVPVYAGQEVLHLVPSEDFLYDPENNIRVGTEYLKLLQDQYFGQMKPSISKQYLVTCSYNWGPHRILRAIRQGTLDPEASSEILYDNLLGVVPSETRGYLIGVTREHRRYRSYFEARGN